MSLSLPPYWEVIQDEARPVATGDGTRVIRLGQSRAFGDGSHETTQLCLLGLGYLLRSGFLPERAIDFGAGTGILSIALALHGVRVEAVEIDEAALGDARGNAALNQVEGLVEFSPQLSEPPRMCDLVVANILGPVLLDFAEPLCARQGREGRMILSGLVGTDVPGIVGRYGPLLAPMRAEVYERGQWRAVVFSP